MSLSTFESRVLCAAVAAITTIVVATLMGGMGYFWAMGSAAGVLDKVALEWEASLRGQRGGIRSGGNMAAFEDYHYRLLEKAALPGEGARSTDSLNVALVTIKDEAPDEERKRPVFPPVTLDVEGLKNTSVLFIGEGPILWKPVKSRSNQRAKLAFEGRAPVAVEGLPHGLLAAMKIEGLDANRSSGVDTVDNDRRAFCRSLRAWVSFYEVSPRSVYVWRVTLPMTEASLIAHEDGFDAQDGRVSSVGTMIYLCDI